MQDKVRSHFVTGLYFLCLISVYCWPLWWNGWPLVFNDTASYLNTADLGTAYAYQSPGYGLFLHLVLRVAHVPEIIPIAQATIVILALWHLGHALNCSRPKRFLVVLLFGLITPIPLMCSMILPDALFFAGATSLLGLILKSRNWKKIGPLSIVMLAMNVHLATGILFIAMLLLSHRLLRIVRRDHRLTHRTGQLIASLALLFVSTQFCLQALYPRGHVTIWPIHLTAQLIDNNGPLIQELDTACQKHSYSLCPHLETIRGSSADNFLWNEKQPLKTTFGNWTSTPSDWAEIIWQTIINHPREMMAWFFERWRFQLFTYQVASEYGRFSWDKNVIESINNVFGEQELNRWANSRQEDRWFYPLPSNLDRVYTYSGYLSHLAPILLWLLWRHDKRRPLATVLFLIVLTNAMIMGTASYPHARYQMRIHYLPLIVLALATAERASSTLLPSVRNKSSKGS